MRVKRYIVKSVPEATQQIRRELGHDAIIISTKAVRSGGIFGLFSKKMFEVIAAVDEAAPAKAPPVRSPQINEARPTPIMKTDVPPSMSIAAANVDNPRVNEMPREEPLYKEIKQMKEMMSSLIQQQSRSDDTWPPLLQKWERILLDQEIDSELVMEILHGVRDKTEGELKEELVVQSIRQQLLAIIQQAGQQPILPQTRLVHFVGPTGVGKTTTIAKLAAEQVIRHRRSVGFITSDTYRIAAVEQLKTYANILNVPLEVAFSPQDMRKAYDNLADRDLIFMDTAGRNFRNEMFVSELNMMLDQKEHSETILVLSLSMKYNDMKAVVNNFTKYRVDKLLFTKMDETSTYGSIINLLHEYQLPMSYMTHGQNVPDDITEIREEQIVDLVLGEK